MIIEYNDEMLPNKDIQKILEKHLLCYSGEGFSFWTIDCNKNVPDHPWLRRNDLGEVFGDYPFTFTTTGISVIRKEGIEALAALKYVDRIQGTLRPNGRYDMRNSGLTHFVVRDGKIMFQYAPYNLKTKGYIHPHTWNSLNEIDHTPLPVRVKRIL